MRFAFGIPITQNSLRDLITRINAIRKGSPALHGDWSLRFHPVDNETLIAYSKVSEDRRTRFWVVVNLDPHNVQSGWLSVALKELKLGDDEAYQVHDLLTEARYVWRGSRKFCAVRSLDSPGAYFPGSSDRLTFAGLTDASVHHLSTSAGESRLLLQDENLWYKDAVITSFMYGRIATATATALAIFRGLTSKLDYLQELGINAIWLLPFYPSPLRDDGYDIADYTSVHPSYGTLQDFKDFLVADTIGVFA